MEELSAIFEALCKQVEAMTPRQKAELRAELCEEEEDAGTRGHWVN